MVRVIRSVREFMKDKSGALSAEYMMLAAAFAVITGALAYQIAGSGNSGVVGLSTSITGNLDETAVELPTILKNRGGGGEGDEGDGSAGGDASVGN